MKNREFIVAIIFIVISLVVCYFFPVNNIFQQIVGMLVFFAILPIVFNKFILKKEVKIINFSIGDYRCGLLWSLYSLIIVGLIFFVISNYFGFLSFYTVPVLVANNFMNFLLYEFMVVAPLVAIYEFYFRGFVMSIFKSKVGNWAILVQAGVFFILVLGSSDNIVQLVPYLIFAPFAGIIAYKSRSILYSGVAQFLILFFLDVVIIKMTK